MKVMMTGPLEVEREFPNIACPGVRRTSIYTNAHMPLATYIYKFEYNLHIYIYIYMKIFSLNK